MIAATMDSLKGRRVANSKSLNEQDKEVWRDFLLQEVVNHLQDNKEQIMARYLEGQQPRLSRAEIEQHHLMDFDVSITLHCDQRSSFGLGLGFFKANMIR